MRRILPAGLFVLLVTAPAVAQPSTIRPGGAKRTAKANVAAAMAYTITTPAIARGRMLAANAHVRASFF